MQKNPHRLIEGMHHRRVRGGREQARSSTSAASTSSRPTSSTRPSSEAYERGYLGEDILGSGYALDAGGPPRRGRLHLRRGDGAARLARGQARQPAPEAAVPRQPGPLPGADADQQRRDAVQRAARDRQRRRVVQVARHREVAGHEGRVGVGQRAAARQLRDRAGHPRARHRLRPRRRPAGGPQDQVLVPGRLVGAGAARARTSTCPTTSSRWPQAGSMLGSGAIIVVDDSVPIVRRRAAAGASSTATSRAASACPAARARTGP